MIYWFTNIDTQTENLRLALASLEAAGEAIEATVVPLKEISAEALGKRDWSDAEAVFIALMGGQSLAEELELLFRESGVPQRLFLASGPVDARRHGIDAEQEQRIQAYLGAGGLANLENLWRFLAREFTAAPYGEIPAPEQMREEGLYYPGEPAYDNVEEYAAAHIDPAKPTIAFLFLRDDWLWGKTEFYDAFIAAIEAAEMNALPLFTHWGRSGTGTGLDENIAKYFYLDGELLPDVVINHHRMSIRLGRATDPLYLENLGLPLLQAYHTKRDYDEWRATQAGLTPTEISSTVAMLECDGVIHGSVVSNRAQDEVGRILREPWEYGIDLMVRKAKKWALLRRKPNAEKKIALVLHNYPPNNAHVGCAADLDSGTSLYLIMKELAAAGYDVGSIPADAESLWTEVMSHVTNDRRYLGEKMIAAATRIAGEEVAAYEADLAPSMQAELRRDWGEAPGDVFADEEDLLLPGFARGNLYIALQPPRGFGENMAAIIHSPDLVPTHHYLAYYHYLRDKWGADAFIHLGTHGSQEWLPGKQMGLSDTCYPLVTMDDMPNLYPYLVTVVGEGIQAKRRGSACLIGYLPAPSEPGGIYGDWEKAEPLLDEYQHYRTYQPEHAEGVLEQIEALVASLGMDDYFGSAAGRADEYILAIHNFLHDLDQRQSRTGLHILGKAPSGAELEALVYQLTLVPQGDFAALPTIIGRLLGVDYDALLENDEKTPAECAAERNVATKARELVAALGAQDWQYSDTLLQMVNLPADEELVALLREIEEDIVPRCRRVEEEMTNLLRGLDGAYVPPSPGGSPSSGNLAALPTGRNYFGIDPSLMPTPTAWKLGIALGDALLEQYIAEEGHYPEQVGIVIWAGPNLRSNGQCLAEIMYLLGVRPIWRPETGKVEGMEVIPTAELGRPRIDVTARISGLVRDALPQAVTLINRAVDAVADLDEDESLNYIKKHIRMDSEELATNGIDPATALKQARYRVFGCPPGAYGAGVGAMLDNKNWDDDNDLADAYVVWGGYAYDEKGEAVANPGAFRRRLATLDITVKNEDTTDVHLMSSDDFNAYHGGMVAAVRALSGKQPKSYVGDSSHRQHVKVRTLAQEFRRVLHGEALNPKFIRGMMKHGHKGALELAKYANLSFGWDATSRTMNDESYNRIAEAYLLDEEVREWMNQVNPWAVHEIAETLMEAKQREFWDAPEDILEQLRDIYLATEGELEEKGES